jgi:hypothetical protein
VDVKEGGEEASRVGVDAASVSVGAGVAAGLPQPAIRVRMKIEIRPKKFLFTVDFPYQ